MYGPKPISVIERIFRKTVYDYGCWLYTGAKNNRGYGVVSTGSLPLGTNSVSLVHRIVFEDAHGGLVDALELDHLCRNPPCCNPIHLEEVTHSENMSRSSTVAASHRRAALQTHCKRGHELAGSNLGLNSAGGRYCRYCHKESMKVINARAATTRRRKCGGSGEPF